MLDSAWQFVVQFSGDHPFIAGYFGIFFVGGFVFGTACSIRQAWEDHVDRKRREQGLKPLFHVN